MATKRTKKEAVPEPVESSKNAVHLLEQAQRNYAEYGAYVIEQRALPDCRDGLKPVQRRVLYSMLDLGLKPTAKQAKSARTIGHVIGRYHPHGDTAAYDAMVGMAGTKRKGSSPTDPWLTRRTCEPLVQGFGNFGDYEKKAADMRYSESKLSQFAYVALLDPEYLRASDFIPNFDDSTTEPVILPAKVPLLLLNGASGIAVGITTDIPSFELKGVIACAKLAINGTVRAQDCYANLVPKFRYGGTFSKADLKTILKDGAGRVTVTATHEYDGTRLRVDCVPPNLKANRILNIMADDPDTLKVNDETSVKGISLVAYPKRLGDDFRERWAARIAAKLKAPLRVAINVTVRNPDGSASFKTMTIPQVFNEWATWRIELERKVITNRINDNQAAKDRLEMVLLAVLNLDTIIKALKVADSEAYLVKALKITDEQAKYILDQPIRRFKQLEAADLRAKIKECAVKHKALLVQHKAPESGIVADLDTLMATTKG